MIKTDSMRKEPSILHLQDAVSDGCSFLAMSHEEDGFALLFLEASQNFQDLPSGGGIEIPCWLIGKNNLRVIDQGPADGHPLHLPSRKFMGSDGFSDQKDPSA